MEHIDLYNGPINQEENDFRDYFFSLHGDSFNIARFKSTWSQMSEAYSPRSLHRALQKTADILSFLDDTQIEQLDTFLSSPEGIERWAGLFHSKLEHLNARQLVSVGWSLGKLEMRPNRDFLIEWRNLLHTKMRGGFLNHLDLRDVILTLSSLQIHPGDRFMNGWFAHARTRLPDFRFSEVAHLLKTAGDLGTRPHPLFLDDCVSMANDLMAKKDPVITHSVLQNYLVGMTMLCAVSDYKIDKQHVRDVIHEIARLEVPDKGTQVLFHQAASFFDLKGYKDHPHKDDQKAEWKSPFIKAFNQVSGFVRFPVEIEGPHYLPDVSGMYRNQKIAIFIDGPNRFFDRLNGGLQYNGHTILKTALMEKTLKKDNTDITALRLCYEDFKRAAENGIDYQSILQEMADASPGIYQSRYNGETIGIAPITI